MPAKRKTPTKRRATTRVAETAAKYTARSSVRARPRARKPKSPGEEMWAAFLKLSGEEQAAFIRKMFSTRRWREDIGDSLIAWESRNEPTRPIEEFWAELDAQRQRK
jgi:hypothetical protein